MIGTAILLLYFGGVNAWLSRYAGTCTMDSADQLGGLDVVLICYALALGLLWKARPGLVAGVLLSALVPVLVWHAGEGARFALGVVVQGQSACTMLVGPEHGMDGREMIYAVLWVVAAWVLPGLILWRLLRNRRTVA